MVLDYEGVKAFTAPLLQPVFLPILYWSLQSIGGIISLWESGDRFQDENDFQNLLTPKNFDFIIVGGGTGGSLLANRLSRYYTVLLLEFGGEPHPLQYVPGFTLFLLNQPSLDWSYRTVPQKHATLISINHESSWSAGKGFGGSLNHMMTYLRGHKNDFDNWAKITGDQSWAWEGVLPFFRGFEDYEVRGDELNHGYRGELRIETPDYTGRAKDFVKAGWELGYPNVDLNAPFKQGFDTIRYPIRNGRVFGPYSAFLEPIRSRSSLTIMKFAQVNKILFKDGNEAYGVEYDRHGKTYTAHCTKEVIISAGAIGTPKLLLLSGVGPQSHLEELNIPVVADLPVGQNLQDHLGVYLGPFFVKEDLGTFFDRDITPAQFVKWFNLGRGRLTSTGYEAVGVISSELAKLRGEGNWPDIAVYLFSFTNFRLGSEIISRAFNIKFDEFDKYVKDDMGKDSLYVVVQGARPVSRGYVKLGGSSPYDKPVIDPNYLGDPEQTDLRVLLEGLKKSLFLMENTTAMGARVGARFTSKKLPGCEHLPFRTDPYYKCFIRRFSVSLHNFVGTASVGSVVDTKLKVFRTKGLRVVDASVSPVLVNTNTQASTLMIAEKGADIILKYWNKPKLYKPEHFRTPTTPIFPIINDDEGLFAHESQISLKSKRNHVDSGFTYKNASLNAGNGEGSSPSPLITPRPRSRSRKRLKSRRITTTTTAAVTAFNLEEEEYLEESNFQTDQLKNNIQLQSQSLLVRNKKRRKNRSKKTQNTHKRKRLRSAQVYLDEVESSYYAEYGLKIGQHDNE